MKALDAWADSSQMIKVRCFVATAEPGEHVGVGVSAHLRRGPVEDLIELQANGLVTGGEAGEEGWGGVAQSG